MSKTAGDILVDTLIAWGVDTVFGIPGDGINGVFESLRQRQDEIRFIQVRHEEAAAFARLEVLGGILARLAHIALDAFADDRHPVLEQPLDAHDAVALVGGDLFGAHIFAHQFLLIFEGQSCTAPNIK